MKFMKLGSKPDQFQTDGDNIRFVATELASDLIVNVGDAKFYLHKFPLLSKSSHLQKLVSSGNDDNDEIQIDDIPGGAAAFEVCAKFCYGMVATLNAYNVVAARCAAEYLEMYETVEKGNLIYKIDVFLTSSIFRSWKDSIIVLHTTKSHLPWSEELKIVSHCLDSIASKASIEPSKVDWSYTYNRKKLPSENEHDPLWNGVRKQPTVPKDWWVEDLCELQIDLYKRVVSTIRAKGRISPDIIGESLQAYLSRRLPGFSKGAIRGGDTLNLKHRYLVDTITDLLPTEINSVPCSFLLKLLQASFVLECRETGRRELMLKIALQLGEATVADFLIRMPNGETALYNIDIVYDLVEQFVMQEHSAVAPEFHEAFIGVVSDASKANVATLVDSYLAEAARDSSLPLSRFLDLAAMVSSFPRQTHDRIYRAIDMFLKEHPETSKSDKKKMCRLMDCRKLSAEACAHAVQNERLPLRVVMQVLYFEHGRAVAAAAAGGSGDHTMPDIPGSIKALLPGGSYSSSRSGTTTNTDEDWDGEEMKSLKAELASLRLKNNGKSSGAKAVKKMSKIWSNENSSSDTSGSFEESRSTPSRSRRRALS